MRFGRVFNFKLGRYAMYETARNKQVRLSLELKTRPGFRPVSFSLSMEYRLPSFKIKSDHKIGRVNAS